MKSGIGRFSIILLGCLLVLSGMPVVVGHADEGGNPPPSCKECPDKVHCCMQCCPGETIPGSPGGPYSAPVPSFTPYYCGCYGSKGGDCCDEGEQCCDGECCASNKCCSEKTCVQKCDPNGETCNWTEPQLPPTAHISNCGAATIEDMSCSPGDVGAFCNWEVHTLHTTSAKCASCAPGCSIVVDDSCVYLFAVFCEDVFEVFLGYVCECSDLGALSDYVYRGNHYKCQ